MKDMDIREAQEKRCELENAIYSLVNEFQRETGTKIKAIHLTMYDEAQFINIEVGI